MKHIIIIIIILLLILAEAEIRGCYRNVPSGTLSPEFGLKVVLSRVK